jgi:hypothetical protein
LSKKENKKVVPFKKAAKKTKPSKAKEKKPIKKVS